MNETDVFKLTLLNKYNVVDTYDELHFTLSLNGLGFDLSQCSIMEQNLTTDEKIFHVKLTNGLAYAILTKDDKIVQVDKQLF